VNGWPDALLDLLFLVAASPAMRWVLGVICLAALVLLLGKAHRRAITPLLFLLGVLFAGGGLLFALHPGLLRHLIQIDYLLRVRIAMGALSFFVLFITLESLRTSWLEERYALLWIGTSLVLLFVAFFPQAIDLLRLLSGLDYTRAVVVVLFAFLLLVCFHFSIALSQHQKRNAILARQQALLAHRVEELEAALGRTAHVQPRSSVEKSSTPSSDSSLPGDQPSA